MLSILFTFAHYALTPIRFILFMLVLNMFFHIIGNLENQIAIQQLVVIGSKMLLYLLYMNVVISHEDVVKYLEYVYTNKKFLVVFNHTTFIDGFILLSTFPCCCFLMLKTYAYNVIGYTEKFHQNTKGIFISKGETTAKIIEQVEKRKSGDFVLFVAPGSGNVASIPGNITEFKGMGAFAGKFPVLPVIIKYEDESLNHNHEHGESMVHSCLKLFLLNNYRIDIKVGDMIEPIENETIEEYKDRVYNIMNDEYHSLQKMV